MKTHKPNTVSIISGTLKGRSIPVPKSAHPMGSRERLALFNSISDYVPGALVLDLYAGSGALGLEAISRGAIFAYFIEKDHKAAKSLERVCQQNFPIDAYYYEVCPMTVSDFINKAKDLDMAINVILADPPYDDFHPEELADVYKLLSDDGILVLSHPESFKPELPHLKCISTKKYANCRISSFTK